MAITPPPQIHSENGAAFPSRCRTQTTSLAQMPKIPGLGSFRRKSNEPEVDPLPRKAAQVQIKVAEGAPSRFQGCVRKILSLLVVNVHRPRMPGGQFTTAGLFVASSASDVAARGLVKGSGQGASVCACSLLQGRASSAWDAPKASSRCDLLIPDLVENINPIFRSNGGRFTSISSFPPRLFMPASFLLKMKSTPVLRKQQTTAAAATTTTANNNNDNNRCRRTFA